MSWILSWVRKILICMILGNILMRLLPNEKYQKYLKLYWGFVTLIVFLNPVLYLVNGFKGLEDLYEKNSFQMEKKQIDEELQNGIAENIKMEIHSLDERLKEQINESLIEDQYEVASLSTDVGQGLSCNVLLKGKKTLGDGSLKGEDRGQDVLVVKERIKNKIYDFYQIEKENIDISIQE